MVNIRTHGNWNTVYILRSYRNFTRASRIVLAETDCGDQPVYIRKKRISFASQARGRSSKYSIRCRNNILYKPQMATTGHNLRWTRNLSFHDNMNDNNAYSLYSIPYIL